MGQHAYTKREKNMVLIASSVAIFITPAMASMVNLALISIGNDFNIGTHDLGWITTTFFISSVAFLLPAARVADLYGKKRTFIIGCIIVLIGNLLSSLATDFWMLCFFRIITGAGAAFISCTGISMIMEVFSRDERGKALGINTAFVYLGASLGPVIGGLLTDALGWRSIFYIIIPMTVVALYAISQLKYKIINLEGSFDIKGSIVYGLSIMFAMYGLMNLPSISSIFSLIIGVMLLFVFIYLQKHGNWPLINLSIFKSTRFSRSIFATLLNYASSYATAFFLSLYLQSIGALSASEASLILLVQPLVQVVLTPFAGKWADSLDLRILPTVGMAITCFGLILLLFVGVNVNMPMIIVALLILGLGYSLFSAPNTLAVMSYVKVNEYSEASSLLSTMRQTGMMLSLGIAMCIISVIMGSADNLSPENYSLFVQVMRTSWIVFILFSVVGCVISWFRGPSQSNENTKILN